MTHGIVFVQDQMYCQNYEVAYYYYRFEFLVIPDGFVIHLPHPSQDTTQLFSKIGR